MTGATITQDHPIAPFLRMDRIPHIWCPTCGLGTVVTAFAAAHAVALLLASVGLLRLPEALVETIIAASTTLAALNLIVPLFRGRIWWIVFGLSLFHGLGFAGGLEALGVLDQHLGLSVLAFNLGIELGQLVIVAVAVPLLFAARRVELYRKVALKVAAVGLILVSGVWVIERAFGVDIPMRELLPASVQKIAVLADSQNRWLNPNLKEYETEVLLAGSFQELKPGATARVEIQLAELNDVLAVPVQAVDQPHQLLRRSVTAGRREIAGRLIAPGALKRKLRNGEQFDMGKVHIAEVLRQRHGSFPVGQKTVPLFGFPPP